MIGLPFESFPATNKVPLGTKAEGIFFVSSKKSGADSDFSLTSDNADGMTALGKLGLVSYSDKALLPQESDSRQEPM